MAVLKGNWYSQTLTMNTHVTVCMPDAPKQTKATVLLLHGLKGDSDVWMNRVGLEFFANKYCLSFVMPEVQRSWYMDMAYGLNYFGYVADRPCVGHDTHPTSLGDIFPGVIFKGSI